MQAEDETNYCTMYIVRHGETEWNVAKINQGQSESILTKNGIKQAQETRHKLKDIHFDAIFSSDLSRCVDTAKIINLDHELVIETSKLLRERTYGKFEGLHDSEYKAVIQEKLKERESLATEEEYISFRLHEEVETDEELVRRFMLKLREIAVAYTGKTVLVVGHAGCIRNFLIHLGYVARKDLPGGSFKNAGYLKLTSDGVNFFIKEVEGIQKPKGGE